MNKDVDATGKTCSLCRRFLPGSRFSRNGDRGYCRDCNRAYQRGWHQGIKTGKRRIAKLIQQEVSAHE